MIKIVYFDRNVVNSIKNQCITGDSEYLLLGNAVREGRLLIPISGPLLEETLPILKSSSTWKRVSEQQIMSELFNWEWVVNFHKDLLEDEIKNYAMGIPSSFAFRSTTLTPEQIFNPSGQMRKDFLRIIDETQELRKKQLSDAKEARRVYQERFGAYRGSFDQFWKQIAEFTVERTADRLGVLKECSERGLLGLLNIKSVRLYVTWYVAYFYYNFIRNERLKPSDSPDHHHAVSASVADILVTHDQKLARMLRLVPIDGFEVVDLRTLLQRLTHPNLFGFDAHDHHPSPSLSIIQPNLSTTR